MKGQTGGGDAFGTGRKAVNNFDEKVSNARQNLAEKIIQLEESGARLSEITAEVNSTKEKITNEHAKVVDKINNLDLEARDKLDMIQEVDAKYKFTTRLL